MQIITTPETAQKLATDVKQAITEHAGPTLCLCAGGSALKIFHYLDLPTDKLNTTTLVMGDDRASGAEEANNYLQLKRILKESDQTFSVLDTSLHGNEDIESYTARLNEQLQAALNQTDKMQIICILGMGEDGHTSGVFPMEAEQFADVYKAEAMYVPVELNDAEFKSRVSLTPAWILANCDAIYAYITGDAKKTKLDELINTNQELHEMPAQLIKLHEQSYVYTDQAL